MISDGMAMIASPAGMRIVAVLVASSIVVWDWRYTLVTLIVTQAAVGAATIQLSDTPTAWALIQTAVTGLACAILWMSANQTMRGASTGRQQGAWWLRLMAVLMLLGGWLLLDIQIKLPAIDPGLAQLFGWLAACALLMLGLGANPMFGGVAVLLWILPVQAFAAMVLEAPALVALIGVLELMIALACGYLVIAERAPEVNDQAPLTDIVFPSVQSFPQPSIHLGAVSNSIGAEVRRRWLSSIAGAGRTISEPERTEKSSPPEPDRASDESAEFTEADKEESRAA